MGVLAGLRCCRARPVPARGKYVSFESVGRGAVPIPLYFSAFALHEILSLHGKSIKLEAVRSAQSSTFESIACLGLQTHLCSFKMDLGCSPLGEARPPTNISHLVRVDRIHARPTAVQEVQGRRPGTEMARVPTGKHNLCPTYETGIAASSAPRLCSSTHLETEKR